MRDGFTSAMQALAKIQYGDQVLKETVDSNKAQYEQQLADVVQMVLTLKVSWIPPPPRCSGSLTGKAGSAWPSVAYM